MKLWVFGSLNIDRVYSVSSIAREGESILASSLTCFPGGKGLNQAVSASRAGLDVVMAGSIGNDGAIIEDFLKDLKIDYSSLLHSECQTGHAMIQVDENGKNSIVAFNGANGKLTTQYIDSMLEKTSIGDAVLLQNETSNVPYIIRKAHEKGLYVIWNPSPITKDIASFPISYVNMLIINEVEAASIAGLGNPSQLLNVLSYKFPSAMIVLTLGAEGAMCSFKDCVYSQPAFKVKPIDTTAAGDTFTGYFVYGILSKMEIQDSLELACKAAAISVSKRGSSPSIPTMKEVIQKVL